MTRKRGIIICVIITFILLCASVWSSHFIWVYEPFDGFYDTLTSRHGSWSGPHYYPRSVILPGIVNIIINQGPAVFGMLLIVLILSTDKIKSLK